jgi:ABC-type sugar transport system permease subunit
MSIKKRREALYGYLLVSPFLFFLFFFIGFPMIYEIAMSVLNTNLQFVGAYYFKQLTVDPNYIESLINTLLYVGVGVNVKMFISLLLANALLLIDFRGKRVYRTLILIPWVIPLVPSALNFRWIFDADYGIVNQILTSIGLGPMPWLTNDHFALATVIFTHIWTNIPFWSLILLSGLQTIPLELYESAKIDGAGAWATFRYLTAPLVRRLYIISLLLSTVWTMGDFTIIWTLTEGGPANATQIVATNAYRVAFEFGEFGYAASMFVVVMPVLALFILVLLRMLKE